MPQNKKVTAALIYLGICVAVLCFVSNSNGQTPKKITAHEVTLRKKSTNVVIPKYPNEAIRAKASGVIVAEIIISEEGNVIDVKILESPHKSISISMIEALKEWKFSPFTIKGVPQKITGKITYYFVLENKRGKVESPY